MKQDTKKKMRLLEYLCSYTSSSLQCVPDSIDQQLVGSEFISARDSHMHYMQCHMYSTFAKLLNDFIH